MSETTQAIKHDQEKPRYELIPPSTLLALATILTFGAKKYAARNWENGMAWSRAFGALMRHLWAWWQGENLDPETGKSHLWHAQCELSFLIEYENTHPELDDRPNTNPHRKEVTHEKASSADPAVGGDARSLRSISTIPAMGCCGK